MNTTTIHTTLKTWKSVPLVLALFAAAANAAPTGKLGMANAAGGAGRPQAGSANPGRKIVDVWPGPAATNRVTGRGPAVVRGGRPPVVLARGPIVRRPIVRVAARRPVVVERTCVERVRPLSGCARR